MKTTWPYYLGGQAQAPNSDLVVYDKYSGKEAAKVALASRETIAEGIRLAHEARDEMRQMPAYERQAVLAHCVKRFEERRDELAESLCIEAGKPIRDSRGEVTRLIDTFRIASEEATRIYGEVMPLDITERTLAYSGMWKRVPVGVCSFITPFNFPLNLVAHKIAPAIAAGCPFVVKPASLTPLGALIIGEVLSETRLPKGAFSILPCPREGAELFTTDPRINLLSFTGSADVGWDLKARAGKKKVVLELGGNAAAIVDEDADVNDAVERMVIGAFYQSGQSCISVQRILVHARVYDAFRDKLVAATAKLLTGDPKDEKTFIGPMISSKEAERLSRWIDDAIERKARVLVGGKRDGAMIEATLLANVPKDCDLVTKEAFGPVAVLSSFQNFDDALREVNDSDFGLQAGIFTRDIYKAHRAWDVLEVGGVVIGDVPSFRVDHMPYGGVKESGLGREGVRWAIEDMTETRMLVLRTKASA
ncbi:MAG: aldehyde dehydrogenase family protein [Sandaracinaceae bacterium]|nr:aldehyde dehydrogenase family protein [Sandaracinaceae bacterium]